MPTLRYKDPNDGLWKELPGFGGSPPLYRLYSSKAALDADWGYPPEGAMAVTTDNGRIYQYLSSTWYTPNRTLHRQVHSTQQAGVGTGGFDLVTSPSLFIPAGRRIELVGHYNLSGTGTIAVLYGKQGGVIMTGRMAQLNAIGGGAILHGSTIAAISTAGAYTFTNSIQTGSGTVTIESGADPGWYEVRDIGAL